MRSNGLKLSRIPGEIPWLGNLSGLGAGSGRERRACSPSWAPEGTRRGGTLGRSLGPGRPIYWISWRPLL